LGRSFLLFPRKQAAFAEDFFGEFVFEAVAKQEAAVGGVAYAEFRDHLFVEAAASEVFAGSRTFWAAEAFLEERYCALVNVEQLPAETGFFGFSGRGVAGFGQRDAELLRYQTDGFPRPPLLLRPVFWIVRNTIGPRLGRKMFARGEMKKGMAKATTMPNASNT